MTGEDYANESLINSLTGASKITINSSNDARYHYNGFFGRVNYKWDNKYILDLSIRRDGSSRFGAGHRFGNFGAVGAGWIFTREGYIKEQKVVSYGKLRTSWGLTGNDQISNNQYSALYMQGGAAYQYNGTNIYYSYTAANPNLHWETNRKFDIGLELGLLNNRILFELNYYNNHSSDLLTSISLPTQSGVSSYVGNISGVIRNRGVELEINSTIFRNRNFEWKSEFNITGNENKLLSYPNLATSVYSQTYVIGRPIDVQLQYHFTGIDKNTGLPVVEDKDNNGLINNEDKIASRTGRPFYGGLTNSLTYKNVALDFTLQFVHRNGYLNSVEGVFGSMYSYGYSYYNQTTAALSRWKKSGDNSTKPLATTSKTAQNAYANYCNSDANWGDASYMKLKNLSISYTIPQHIINKTNIDKCKIYIQGQNIFCLTREKYTYDPESCSPNLSSNQISGRYIAYPALRTITVGVNVTL